MNLYLIFGGPQEMLGRVCVREEGKSGRMLRGSGTTEKCRCIPIDPSDDLRLQECLDNIDDITGQLEQFYRRNRM